MTDVTVVVATRNRRSQLVATLARHAAPVIVVDNGSDDGTPEAVARAFPDVRVVRLHANAGAAAARNVGVALADTPFVAFADDDSWWAPGSLDRAARLLRGHPRTGLLTGQVRVGPQGRLDPVSAAMARAPLGVPPDAPGPAVLGFLACAVVLRREAFRQVGGFAEPLGTYGEEALLAMDLAAAGWRLAYAEELVVHHHPLPAGRDRRTRQRVEARNRLLTATLRRPAGVLLRTVTEVARDPAGRGALLDAARELRWALPRRRRLPARVEAALRTLERLDAEPPAAPQAPRPSVVAAD
ncbi:glycosyltransferase [Micromonospora sp. C28SCA-DRY-2]|uniref:glycosyltransferase family 2 protein n=1 Tax=Micromonospora sp. C28SCA-DRY-2 TaxID=3059522 RepID=UPI002674E4A1|nr:glycosyltransferase [Micromonospora sp. C28SCA-DRY-2]MDO3704915.1 glycosyltransferase [Micromonospora sp. C28SCA-DRY-2]